MNVVERPQYGEKEQPFLSENLHSSSDFPLVIDHDFCIPQFSHLENERNINIYLQSYIMMIKCDDTFFSDCMD